MLHLRHSMSSHTTPPFHSAGSHQQTNLASGMAPALLPLFKAQSTFNHVTSSARQQAQHVQSSCHLLRSWALFSFSAIFHHLFCTLSHSFPHSFPHAPLGPPPNHLTSHLMDHLTIPQSDITCHHSAVRSIPQHYHLTLYGLPAHCHVMMRPPAHDGAILRTASS